MDEVMISLHLPALDCSLSNRRTSRESQLSTAGSLRMSEPLALKTSQRIRNHLPYSSVSLGTPKRGTTSRLTRAGSLLSPIYSEAWAKGNAEVSPDH
ncbi:hypothetical protein TNCV_2579061 [Trichonephila clavipes]|nr:hypothetical protein TNCV_2579061 [Trichonephila clavipes]